MVDEMTHVNDDTVGHVHGCCIGRARTCPPPRQQDVYSLVATFAYSMIASTPDLFHYVPAVNETWLNRATEPAADPRSTPCLLLFL